MRETVEVEIVELDSALSECLAFMADALKREDTLGTESAAEVAERLATILPDEHPMKTNVLEVTDAVADGIETLLTDASLQKSITKLVRDFGQYEVASKRS